MSLLKKQCGAYAPPRLRDEEKEPLKRRVMQQLSPLLDGETVSSDALQEALQVALADGHIVLSRSERQLLTREILAELQQPAQQHLSEKPVDH